MVFPTVGSWISEIKTQPDSTGITTINFIGSYTLGSSNVEYAVYDVDNLIDFIPYTTANNGSNTINISDNIAVDYRIHFRMIGYPSLGFKPSVRNLSINVTGIGAEMQTSVLGSDILLSSTNFSKAYVQPEGDYYWNTQGSVSSDGGNTWTPVPNYGNEFDLTSTLGSECVIKLVDVTGSVVLTNLVAYFHTGDVK